MYKLYSATTLYIKLTGEPTRLCPHYHLKKTTRLTNSQVHDTKGKLNKLK